MKPGEFTQKLGNLSSSLANLGAKDSAVRVAEVAEFVGSSQLKSVAELAKRIHAASPETSGEGETVGSAGVVLIRVARLVEAVGGAKAFIADLKTLGEALEKPALQGAIFSELRAALERPAPPPQPINDLRTELVVAYLRRLEAALGETEFHNVFVELKANKKMRQQEIAALASAFMSKGPSKETRPNALNRILARHQNLESIAGRNKAGRAAA